MNKIIKVQTLPPIEWYLENLINHPDFDLIEVIIFLQNLKQEEK
jgi:hypothetical protein